MIRLGWREMKLITIASIAIVKLACEEESEKARKRKKTKTQNLKNVHVNQIFMMKR
jgi:hypothetical protein